MSSSSSILHTIFSVNAHNNPSRLTIPCPNFLQRRESKTNLVLFRLCPGALYLTAPQSNESPTNRPHWLAASVILALGFFSAASLRPPPVFAARPPTPVSEESTTIENQSNENYEDMEKLEDGELKEAFETWKSKTYALSVPLNVVALHGSLPPSWVKDFTRSQGKRLRFRPRFLGSPNGIFSDLSLPLDKIKVGPSSVVSADIASVGDSWLSIAIKKSIIEPIQGVDDQNWFKCLSDKWKTYLRRNHEGKLDPEGKIWAAPYRWGSMVIAYKKSKFHKHKLAPIEDWADLWRPELAGRISMVDSPREIVGAVLKSMGASYNTNKIDVQVPGGRNAVQRNLVSLGNQVRLFDSMHYLKAFSVGDVWVAVGWSSDVLPAVQRMSNVAVVVPKSGASLWADLWAIPASSRIKSNKIGGRVRGPSPLIHQWIDFCLQPARALPFKQAVIPGASPSALEGAQLEVPKDLSKNKPKLETNLIAGVPPLEILENCEFLEPLSDDALSDYQWLISSIRRPDLDLVDKIQHFISPIMQSLCLKLHPKVGSGRE